MKASYWRSSPLFGGAYLIAKIGVYRGAFAMANREQHSRREARKPKKDRGKLAPVSARSVEGLIDKARPAFGRKK
jgi:hypothetical protein